MRHDRPTLQSRALKRDCGGGGMAFTISGQVRGGKNNVNVTRTGHRYPDRSWALWRDRVVNDLLSIKGLGRYENPCKIEVKYWAGDRRKRDVPAMIDALWSCFEKAGIVRDDCQFTEVHWLPMGYSKQDPKVEVRIEEIHGRE